MAAALATLVLAVAPSGTDARVKLKRIGRFHSPVYVTVAPDVPGLFVVEQPGRVKLVQGKRRRSFLNIAGQVISGGEQGLLSIAFPPDFATSRLFYAYFTNRAGDNEVDEFQATPDGARVLPGSQRQVMLIPHPTNSNHNGGQLQFGPDGFLYIGTGDGGGSGDRPDNAQNTNSLLGKILRIDPRAQGGQPYASPGSNPFAGGAGRDEVYSLRAPQPLPLLLRPRQQARRAPDRDRRRRPGPLRGDRLRDPRRRPRRQLRLERLRGIRALRGRPPADRRRGAEADQGLLARRRRLRADRRLRGQQPEAALAARPLRLRRLLHRQAAIADSRARRIPPGPTGRRQRADAELVRRRTQRIAVRDLAQRVRSSASFPPASAGSNLSRSFPDRASTPNDP